jgi:hypothetical protein
MRFVLAFALYGVVLSVPVMFVWYCTLIWIRIIYTLSAIPTSAHIALLYSSTWLQVLSYDQLLTNSLTIAQAISHML